MVRSLRFQLRILCILRFHLALFPGCIGLLRIYYPCMPLSVGLFCVHGSFRLPSGYRPSCGRICEYYVFLIAPHYRPYRLRSLRLRILCILHLCSLRCLSWLTPQDLNTPNLEHAVCPAGIVSALLGLWPPQPRPHSLLLRIRSLVAARFRGSPQPAVDRFKNTMYSLALSSLSTVCFDGSHLASLAGIVDYCIASRRLCSLHSLRLRSLFVLSLPRSHLRILCILICSGRLSCCCCSPIACCVPDDSPTLRYRSSRYEYYVFFTLRPGSIISHWQSQSFQHCKPSLSAARSSTSPHPTVVRCVITSLAYSSWGASPGNSSLTTDEPRTSPPANRTL